MTTVKIAISMNDDVFRRAQKEVGAGRAKSLSAFVTEAVDEKLRRDELAAVLDELDAEHGKPGREARAWARRVLGRSSSTRGR